MIAKKHRIVKIGGKTIDVSTVPRIVKLRFGKISKKIRKCGRIDISQNIEDMAEIASMICVKQESEMTKDWFLDEIDYRILIAFVRDIFEPYTSAPVGRNLITQVKNQEYVEKNQEYVDNGPLAKLFEKLFDQLRKLKEAVLNALQSVFFRRVSELPPVNENYKNSHKIALEDRKIQWIFASFRSKRRREEEPLVSVSDFFSYSVGGGCLAGL
jgi:hypothetical protein